MKWIRAPAGWTPGVNVNSQWLVPRNTTAKWKMDSVSSPQATNSWPLLSLKVFCLQPLRLSTQITEEIADSSTPCSFFLFLSPLPLPLFPKFNVRWDLVFWFPYRKNMGDCEDHLAFIMCLTGKTLGVLEGDWHCGYIYINIVEGTGRNRSVKANSCSINFGGLALEQS